MLSYPIDEAEELLSKRLAAAKQSFQNCEEDLEFLREQITVCFWYFMIWNDLGQGGSEKEIMLTKL